MMSPFKVKLLSLLPKTLRTKIVSEAIEWYIKKYVDLEINGLEKLNNIKGPIIFVCNHLSNSDALILNKVLKEKSPYFVAGIKLTKDPVTNFGMEVVKTININPNTPDKEAINQMIKTVKNGKNMLIFPEGTRSRTASMNEGKKGVLLPVRLTKANVVPISICGSEKVLPISKNGNMGDEKWQIGKVTVNIGEAIDMPKKVKEETKHEYDNRCIEMLMKKIAVMLPESYRGVYE